ncbi:MAG: Rad52/Rad22 family DNA repair protein [Desulfobacterales bacterium]|jgi:hypothetical protein|nr:Rad52/Rad22 family DNA repair protein [Desulfobacterales bacterium]
MNREILEKPFGPEQIKQREGHYGRTFDYVEGHAVIKKLNDAFDSEWSFSILKHEILKDTDEVIVLGELKAGDIVKTQFGSSRITRARETGEMISIACDLKAAGTDSLKKCATMLGVGLHLYNRTNAHMGQNGNGSNGVGYRSQQEPNHDQPSRGDRTNGNGNGNGGNNSRPPGNGNGNGNNHPNRSDCNERISDKQMNYLMQLNEDRGRSKAQLDSFCKEAYGCVVEHISKRDASGLIRTMLPN